MSDDLVTWLRAQLDEDAAEIAKHDEDDDEDPWGMYASAESNYPCTPFLRLGTRRASAEVESKRRIVDLHPQAHDPDAPAHCETCRYIEDPDDPEPFAEAGYPCPTLRALALPYADRPGYRDEWRP